jgi:basic membrane protein A
LSKFIKVFALLLVFALIAAACGDGDSTDTTADDGGTTATTAAPDDTPDTTAADDTPDTTAAPTTTMAPMEPVTVGLVYDIGGRGDQSFNDAAAAGIDRAIADFGVEVIELEPNEGGDNRIELLDLASSQGSDLVIGVGFLFADSLVEVAAGYPDVKYAGVDAFMADLDEGSNSVSLLFAEEQGSFLVGAAAALKSETGHVGFIGGVTIDLIKKFEAGFVAGATTVNPDIVIDINYLTEPPDFGGFGDPAKGKEAALAMYQGGADVVYHAAGGSGLGLFQAAQEISTSTGSQVWAIGVDSDQYLTAGADLQPYILTSMLKRVDVAVYNTIQAVVDGMFAGGYQTFDLSVDGVGYATSGGFVDDIAGDLDAFKAQIISGDIVVPTTP